MSNNTPLIQPCDPRVTNAMQLLAKQRGLKVPVAMLADHQDSTAPNKQMWVHYQAGSIACSKAKQIMKL